MKHWTRTYKNLYYAGIYTYHPTKPNAVTGVTRHINYITAGDGMTAIVLQEEDNGTTTEKTYFTYKDHLGSIVALTDDNGDVVLEQSFGACSVTLKFDDDNQSNFLVEPIPSSEQANRGGRYRNPDNWTYNNVLESPTWLRGYTGHSLSRCIFSMFSYEVENSSKISIGKHLPHFDLINMFSETYIFWRVNEKKYLVEQIPTTIEKHTSGNGRIYDPILGRMLSPDRFVQSPGYSQSYNRYSYCWNNPLRYTDPSGDVVVAIAVGFAIGAYIGGATVNNTFAAWNWDFSDKNTWIGMGIGGVVGGLGGWSVGAKMAAKAAAVTSSKATFAPTTANLLSGTMNAMYSYDSNQGLGWHTLAHFGAGMLGGHVANTLGLLPGLMVGGASNVAAHVGNYKEQGDPIGYQAAQKFVGGALTAYAGAAAQNTSFGYVKGFKNKYLLGKDWIGKGASYAIQNYAQTFAYSSKDDFLGMDSWRHFALMGSGFASGVGNFIIGKIDFESFWLNSDARVPLGFANFALIDYSLNHSIIYGNKYGGPTQYKGMGQKTRIGTMKNLFMYLFIGDEKAFGPK